MCFSVQNQNKLKGPSKNRILTGHIKKDSVLFSESSRSPYQKSDVKKVHILVHQSLIKIIVINIFKSDYLNPTFQSYLKCQIGQTGLFSGKEELSSKRHFHKIYKI